MTSKFFTASQVLNQVLDPVEKTLRVDVNSDESGSGETPVTNTNTYVKTMFCKKIRSVVTTRGGILKNVVTRPLSLDDLEDCPDE